MTSPYPVFAFHVLESKLNHIKPKYSLTQLKSLLNYNSNDDEKSPLFVTWNIKVKGEDHLRGCIGTFSPLDLDRGIHDYALISAFDDNRFSPITLKELPNLSVSITLLQHFETGDDIYDWELGKHGVKIKFNKNGHDYGATFLPDVAVEQGWDKEETIQHLIAKSGYYKSDKINVDDISLTRYQGLKTSTTFQEYHDTISSL